MKSSVIYFLIPGLMWIGSFGLMAQPEEEKISLQFPNNPVSEVASYYEMLTNKRLVRDSDLTGANLAIVVPEPVTRAEAVALIEAALLLNGYSLVPVDKNTAKLLGPSKQPRSESVPLFASVADLPDTDQVVSFFMPFHYLSQDEAAAIFNAYVAVRPYGSIVQVPNVNALVITENVPLIKRLIALKQVIDVEGARTVTEFFSLQRADAEKVADILTKFFEKKEGNRPVPASTAPSANSPEGTPPPADPGALNLPQPAVQIIPDLRTNRVIVSAPEQQMPLIRRMAENLDVAVPFEEPFERALRFVAAGEVMPVLANLLSEREDSKGGTPAPTRVESAMNSMENPGGQSSGLSGGTKPDKLRAPNESTAPLSMIVGNSRIIADRSSNKIIVIGPPESRSKAERVLDMLDQRPKQIYLATVIGQLSLGDGIDAGIDYLMRFGNVRIMGQGTAANLGNLIQARNAGVDLVPGTSELAESALGIANQVAGQALPLLSGLTVFGTIADSVDIYARALASTNRFQIISRPVVYTANNKKAVISSGQQVPVPQSTLTSAVTADPLGTAITSNIEYKDVVLKLEVIPLINSNNEVTLTIAQQNDNIQENVEISNNQVPVIGTQELTTTVTVPNGQTIILGGLITNQEQRLQTGIPFLKDIPGLGYLFSSTKKDVTRRELIVLIQPFIIDSEAQLANANENERARSAFQQEVFNGQMPIKKALLPEVPGNEKGQRFPLREARSEP